MDNQVTQEAFDHLADVVYNHRHLQYDQTKTLNISSTRYVNWRVLDFNAAQAIGTRLNGDFECPVAGTIINVYAYVDTAGTTSTCTIDINKGGTTIMSATKITIDSTEKTSRTAATPPVISTNTVAVGDIFTVDIDAVHTTPAKGLSVVIVIQ